MTEKNKHSKKRTVYVIDGARTPLLKAKGIGPFSAAEMAIRAGQGLLAKLPIQASDINQVILGCTMPSPDEANIARIIALRLGCGNKVPGWTVHRNCGSGMQAVDNAAHDISSGRSELVLAGGVDVMSRAPLVFGSRMVKLYQALMMAKTLGQKAKAFMTFRPSFLAPIIALERGLTDPVVGLSMGQTAENLAYRFNISREEMDEFAAQSHLRVLEAQKNKWFEELITLYDSKGNFYEFDDGVRADSTAEKLATLKPYFDKKYGSVTPGNSSQITDGAAMILLASGAAVKKYKLPVLGKIVDVEWAALDPSVMGLGPAFASANLLHRNNVTVNDIDYWEINEAFAAQVLACVRALDDETFCQKELGLPHRLGNIPMDRLNVEGGAVAIGHPIGASGARIVLQLLKIMRRNQARRGIASLCIGGGQGGAMLLENTDVVSNED